MSEWIIDATLKERKCKCLGIYILT